MFYTPSAPAEAVHARRSLRGEVSGVADGGGGVQAVRVVPAVPLCAGQAAKRGGLVPCTWVQEAQSFSSVSNSLVIFLLTILEPRGVFAWVYVCDGLQVQR